MTLKTYSIDKLQLKIRINVPVKYQTSILYIAIGGCKWREKGDCKWRENVSNGKKLVGAGKVRLFSIKLDQFLRS